MKRPCERPLSRTPSQVSEESQRGEFEGKFFVLHESFNCPSTGIWSEIYWALWSCWTGLLRFGTFLFEEKVICGLVTSGQRWMVRSGFPASRGLSQRGKNQRFAVARRKTRKHKASFNKTKYMAFLCRDVISFIHLSPSVETFDQSEKFFKLTDLVGAIIYCGLYFIIVSVQSNRANCALHIKRNRF